LYGKLRKELSLRIIIKLNIVGKITVKHYLNVNKKEEQSKPSYIFTEKGFIPDLENIYYPVYLQITVNRKTTKLRSFTGNLLSKEDFELYLKGDEKKIYSVAPSYLLKTEIEDATNALDYFYNVKDSDQNKYPIKNAADFYMLDIDGYKVKRKFNNETIFSIDNQEYNLLFDEIIKADVNPAFLADFFNKQLQYDLYRLFKNESTTDIFIAYELFFRFMPKDRSGKIIGKMINWYHGNLRETYRSLLKKNKFDVERYFSALDEQFEYFEKYGIMQI
jgi:hypothetical protein